MSILESKLDRDLNGPGSRRSSPQRQSSQFNILPKEIDEGVMIDVSMVAQTHLARKASFMSKSGAGNKSGKFGGSGVNSAGLMAIALPRSCSASLCASNMHSLRMILTVENDKLVRQRKVTLDSWNMVPRISYTRWIGMASLLAAIEPDSGPLNANI